MTKFRDYTDSQNYKRVEETYANALLNQTHDFVAKQHAKYTVFDKSRDIWQVIKLLDDIIDESDPDTDLPQSIHALQTYESIKAKYVDSSCSIKELFSDDEWKAIPLKYRNTFDVDFKQFYKDIVDWSWFPVVGFIHDLGKVMALPEFGALPQWAVVGDTFPMNVMLDKNFVYYDKDYHINNHSINRTTLQEEYSCGFDQLTMSWGHDEYLARVLERNKTELPDYAIYLIRYHSFYSWHTPKNGSRGYVDWASNYDWYMLPLLKALQKSDLYSKTTIIPPFDLIKGRLEGELQKWLGNKPLYW